MLDALRRFALTLALWLAGLWLQFFPMLSTGFARVEGDWNDTRLVNYFLEHSWRWVLRVPTDAHFWQLPAFFPTPNSAAYSDVLLSVAPAYWFFRWVGLPADSSMQLWLIAMATLNYLAAFLFLRRIVRVSPDAAALGAFLFAFGAPRSAQVMHSQLLPHFFTIAALYALWRVFEPVAGDATRSQDAASPRDAEPRAEIAFARRQRLSPWPPLLGASVVAQAYASVYYSWFLGFALAIGALWALAVREERRALGAVLRRDAPSIAVGVVLSVVLIAPLATHYLGVARTVGYRSFDMVESMLPRPVSWFYYGQGNWLYGWFTQLPLFRAIPMEHEHRLGFGFATLVIAMFGIWPERRRPWARVMLLTCATLIVLVTLWAPHVTVWTAIFRYVPSAAALRAISRVGILLLIPASIGVALTIDRLLRIGGSPARSAPGRRSQRALVVFLASVVVLEQGGALPSFSRARARERVAVLARAIPAHCTTFLYTPVEPNGDPNWYHGDAMWASFARDIPTLNGYSGNFPHDWPFYDVIVRKAEQDTALGNGLAHWVRQWGLDPVATCRVRLVRPGPPSTE